MKKILLAIGICLPIGLIVLFDRTASLLMEPLVTPAAFLASMPSVTLSLFGQELILIQPSSTLIVYFLGFLMLGLGIAFLRTRGNERSRVLFGVALVLWGLGTLFAGSSYQAFGYELKGRGMDYCLFTDKLELIYLWLTACSIDMMVVATAFSSVAESNQKSVIRYAILHGLAYFVFLFIGIVTPIRFLVSYEGFMLFMGGNFILMFVLNILHYQKKKDLLNRNFIVIWLLFLGVNLGYFIYLFGGFGESLEQNQGIWFHANDMLHVLLIAWAVAIGFFLGKSLQDTPRQVGGPRI